MEGEGPINVRKEGKKRNVDEAAALEDNDNTATGHNRQPCPVYPDICYLS